MENFDYLDEDEFGLENENENYFKLRVYFTGDPKLQKGNFLEGIKFFQKLLMKKQNENMQINSFPKMNTDSN